MLVDCVLYQFLYLIVLAHCYCQALIVWIIFVVLLFSVTSFFELELPLVAGGNNTKLVTDSLLCFVANFLSNHKLNQCRFNVCFQISCFQHSEWCKLCQESSK